MALSVLLEICVDSFASAVAAKAGGADRLEVCSSLALGGTTPSLGLVEQCVSQLELPVMMMIRPHEGGFVYDRDDLETMRCNINAARTVGVQGFVFGALTAQRTVDRETCLRLNDAAETAEITYHRAFDLVTDPLRTLAELEELGIHRVLTSGQQATAMAGAGLIRKLNRHANSIKILAGAGVDAENAQELVEQTCVQEIHASASVLANDEQANGDVRFGSQRRVTSPAKVRAIKDAVTRSS